MTNKKKRQYDFGPDMLTGKCFRVFINGSRVTELPDFAGLISVSVDGPQMYQDRFQDLAPGHIRYLTVNGEEESMSGDIMVEEAI